jgi:integrase
MVERAGIAAKMPFKVHPHMLRHATGYALAAIQSTVRYTELAPGRLQEPVAVTLRTPCHRLQFLAQR